jgi:hypothetical protein
VPVTDADPAVISLAWPRGRVGPAVEAFVEAARHVAASKSDSPGPLDVPGSIPDQRSPAHSAERRSR